MRRIGVVVPAGGTGTRIGRRVPKQFLRLGNTPILLVTLRHFVRHPEVAGVVVPAPPAYLDRTRRLVARAATRVCEVRVVPGGATRQESVWRGLAALPEGLDLVLVHDAVRPFITRALIDAVARVAADGGAAVCAMPIAETVKRVRDGVVEATLDRRVLWSVQTPQGFRAALLREAHDKARRDGAEATDDAMLVERLGHAVRVVPGLPGNIKITTPADLRVARGTARR
jgi:2-C-methyl-D-erythritol 4-phosphate cytidylyltransferase